MGVNFESTCQELKIEYRVAGTHKHSRSGWIQIDCPFCGPGTRKFHLGYPIGGFILSCWKCGQHSLSESLHEASNADWRTIQHLIRGWEKGVQKSKLPQRGRLQMPQGADHIELPHKKYLRCRRFRWKQIEAMWMIQGTTHLSKLCWRIIIPIIQNGQTVSWTSRSIGDSGPRYISADPKHETVPHKETLYGEDYCRHTVIICEGPMDVWRIGPGAVATYGTSFTDAQILRLLRFPRRIVCFDNESHAQQQARSLCKELAQFPGETMNIILNASDPDAATSQELLELRQKFLT